MLMEKMLVMGAESIKNPLIDFAVSRDGRGGRGGQCGKFSSYEQCVLPHAERIDLMAAEVSMHALRIFSSSSDCKWMYCLQTPLKTKGDKLT